MREIIRFKVDTWYTLGEADSELDKVEVIATENSVVINNTLSFEFDADKNLISIEDWESSSQVFMTKDEMMIFLAALMALNHKLT